MGHRKKRRKRNQGLTITLFVMALILVCYFLIGSGGR
jgi:hypothetical protein